MRIKTVMLVLMVLLGACQPAEESLKFVVIPAEDAFLTRRQWGPVADYLSEGLGQKVELLMASDYTAVVEAMKYKHADIARFGPASYVMAVDEGADIEPIVMALKAETGLPGYYALLIAQVDTDISDLTKLTLGLVDVGSTSGGVLPSMYFDKMGIEPKHTLYAGSHGAVILAVQNGTVDVGATNSTRLSVALQQGVYKEGEFQIIWKSEMIPNSPIVVQSTMAQKTKDKLVELFYNIPEDIMLETATDEIGYVKADDATYDPVREIVHYKDQ